MIDLTTVTFLG